MSTLNDLKRPVNVIGLGIGLLSLLLSVVFYYNSQITRKPTFLLDEKRPKIYDSKISSANIKVLDKNSVAIIEDIYLLTISFWNAGALPIEPDDVRKPVRISLSGVKQLIDHSIVNQTSPDITQIKVTEVPRESSGDSNAQLEMSWMHLDPNSGVRLQILYTGQEDASISFSGNIVGVNEIADGRAFVTRSRLGRSLSFIIGVLSGFFGTAMIVFSFRRIKMGRRRDYLLVLSGFVTIALIAALIYMFLYRGLTPPV